ncbi:hypothetical protein BH23BAC4_BH23BAC4_03740 [soil metagenome]
MADEQQELVTEESPFSYNCGQCNRCCHGKRIPVNPYETARLGRRLALSTTDVLDRFVDDSRSFLRTTEAGACVFLGPSGCTVHADRPLACRLYPLGRIVDADGGVRFVTVQPHPQTDGKYGTSGTVGDYLAGQDIEAFVDAADRYYEVLLRLVNYIGSEDAMEEAPPSEPDESVDRIFVDMDFAAAKTAGNQVMAASIEDRLEMHLQAIHEWLDSVDAGDSGV